MTPTRNQLRPLENQAVHYTGRLKEQRSSSDGNHWDCCLVGVEVRQLRTDIPLRDVPVIKVDHLWIRTRKGHISTKGLLSKVEGSGVVGWYRRTGDHSVDLGIQASVGICLNLLWDQVCVEPNRGERFHLMNSAIEGIDEGAHYWSWTHPAEEVVAALRDGVDRYLKNSAMNWGARAIAPSNGRCMGLDPLRLPKPSKKTTVKGFA